MAGFTLAGLLLHAGDVTPTSRSEPMPPRRPTGSGGTVFHVMNRAVRRAQLFESSLDYDAFFEVLCQAADRVPMRLLAYAIMPNHWHMVVWPLDDHDLSRYMQWLTRTHAQRWLHARGWAGTGAVYQGRYKAVPIKADRHLLVACRYVERNPLRAGLVNQASAWPWSSAATRRTANRPGLSPWPVPKPPDWTDHVERPQCRAEHEALQACIVKGLPFGTPGWTKQAAHRLGLSSRLRGRGRPPRARE
jgi:putative transposase